MSSVLEAVNIRDNAFKELRDFMSLVHKQCVIWSLFHQVSMITSNYYVFTFFKMLLSGLHVLFSENDFG